MVKVKWSSWGCHTLEDLKLLHSGSWHFWYQTSSFKSTMILQRWARSVFCCHNNCQWTAKSTFGKKQQQQRLTWCCCFCETFARFHTSGILRCHTQSAVQMQSSSIVWYLLKWTYGSGNDSFLTLIMTAHPVRPSLCGHYVRDSSTLQCGAL